MNNKIENFAEANIATAQLQVEVQKRNVEKTRDILKLIAGIEGDEFNILKDRLIAIVDKEKIKKYTKEEVIDVIGGIIYNNIATTMKLATEKRLLEYVRDYMLSIISYHEFENNIDSLVDGMLADNQKFKEDIENLSKELLDSAATLEDTLRDNILIAETDEDRDSAEAFLNALLDVTDLKFLKLMNVKRINKILRNETEFQKIKLKAMKLLVANGLEVDFNHYERCLLNYLTKTYKDTISKSLINNITILICTKLYVDIGATKRINSYKLGFMSFSKNMFSSLLLEEVDANSEKKINILAFRRNLDKIISDMLSVK